MSSDHLLSPHTVARAASRIVRVRPFGQLTRSGSRTLVRCWGRWPDGQTVSGGMNRSHCLEEGDMRLIRTFGLAAGLAMVGSIALAGGASAQPIEHTDFHDEFTEIEEDFCDVAGLTVQVDQVVDG